MTILRKRIIFQHKDYPRGKTLPNLYAKRQFRVLVSLIYQNTRRVCSVDKTPYYVEILNFRYFYRHCIFVEKDGFERKKVIKDYINVSVVINLV